MPVHTAPSKIALSASCCPIWLYTTTQSCCREEHAQQHLFVLLCHYKDNLCQVEGKHTKAAFVLERFDRHSFSVTFQANAQFICALTV